MAIIYLALFLTILMVMAAIVVDIGNARQQRTSAQSAVDGAALSAAQVLDTTKTVQDPKVFDLAANTVYNALSMHHATTPTGACAAVAPAVCEDYQYTSNSVVYDVQVTTPFAGPGTTGPDSSMLNVQTCWSVPTVFGRVIGQNTIPICATATAQNGVGTGGPSNGGCGTNNELTQIQNTFTNAAGNQTISAVFDTSTSANPFPLDATQIHFVVQTQYGNFVQLTKDPSGISKPANNTFGMSPLAGGTKVTLSYTLPTTIDTNTTNAYSNTFSANLQVIDTAGRHCGNASWSTCGAGGHDPLFDGSYTHDMGSPSNGWGTDAANGLRGVTDDTDQDGKDLNSAADSDDTVWPVQGTLVSAGRRIGAIYNDENPLRAASVSMVIDGQTVGYGGAGWASNTYTFIDPSTVTTALPSLPTVIGGMPGFGSVDNAVSTAAYRGGGLRITLMDTMGNPMSGETVSVSTIPGTLTSGLNGRAQFGMPADGTYTVTYSGTRGNGTFQITTSGGGTSVTKAGTVGASPWPNYANTKGYNQSSLPLGGSMGIMYNSTGLADGWHSAVLFANDGDVNNQGGDCGIVAWAFSSTGGSSGPGTLHLVT